MLSHRLVGLAVYVTLTSSSFAAAHDVVGSGPSSLALRAVTDTYWDALNSSVGGRLNIAIPFARACFTSANVTGGSFSEAGCETVEAGYDSADVRTNLFPAYTQTQWESCQSTSQQCGLDWTNPTNPAAFTPPRVCSQGSVPPYYIDVQSASDVQAAFSFSKKTGVPLVIKNTGHDYLGRSSTANSLALWTHNLQNKSYDANFVPEGCPSSTPPLAAATFGAGVQFKDVFQFADDHNITLPGGTDGTVGAAGGYIQGGGHSPLTNIYGLGVDRVLQYEVVVPTGKHLIANDCQNQDLFYALRGGGGSTFGVVLSVSMRALPASSYTVVAAQYTADADQVKDLYKTLVANSVEWSSSGWSGILLPPSSFFYASIQQSTTEAAISMKPLQDFVESVNGTYTILTAPSYLFVQNNFASAQAVPVGVPLIASSRLVSASALNNTPDALVDALSTVSATAIDTLIFANTPYSFVPFEGTTTPSVNPAWREAIWHVVAGTGWNFDTSVDVQKQFYTNLTQAVDTLRDLTQDSGAYLNEADVYEPNWQQSFFGSNYDELVSIKKKYDPDQILDCWRCVNWSGASNSRFQCYLSIPGL